MGVLKQNSYVWKPYDPDFCEGLHDWFKGITDFIVYFV